MAAKIYKVFFRNWSRDPRVGNEDCQVFSSQELAEKFIYICLGVYARREEFSMNGIRASIFTNARSYMRLEIGELDPEPK